jgi:hypothetical protein
VSIGNPQIIELLEKLEKIRSKIELKSQSSA